jgi:uncharacterized protein YjiS (DUF1127 family)
MAAQPARQRAQPVPRRAPVAPARAARLEQRRRRRHLQRLRRDALTDLMVALVVTIFVLIATAGLGVVAILEVPAAALLIASFVIERRRRR